MEQLGRSHPTQNGCLWQTFFLSSFFCKPPSQATSAHLSLAGLVWVGLPARAPIDKGEQVGRVVHVYPAARLMLRALCGVSIHIVHRAVDQHKLRAFLMEAQ